MKCNVMLSSVKLSNVTYSKVKLILIIIVIDEKILMIMTTIP